MCVRVCARIVAAINAEVQPMQPPSRLVNLSKLNFQCVVKPSRELPNRTRKTDTHTHTATHTHITRPDTRMGTRHVYILYAISKSLTR